ncbi:MAG: phosphotransferase enzyme family protein, partial [Solirubrobacteraceae bacterium]
WPPPATSCGRMSPAASVDTARAALALFGLGNRARLELMRYGENTTYRVHAERRSFALRLARPGYHTAAGVASELAWMESLRQRGITTPAAVAGADGELAQHVALGDGSTQLAVAFEWVDGVPLSQVQALDPWNRLGALMAEVHQHAEGWSPPPGFARPAWDLDALVGDRPRWGTPVPDGVWSASDRRVLLSARGAVAERVGLFGTEPERFGLIHTDLGFENVLVQADGSAVVIDFDDCGPSWYLYDIASVLYPLEGSPGFESRRDALTAGYRTRRQLPEDELAELPTFLMCRRLVTLGWTFSRPDTGHARRQRPRRLATSPAAARRFLQWHADHPPR